jgi:hypothetical protein
MDTQFGLYPQFYVKRKDLLFPLIEKYSGVNMKKRKHGEAIAMYLHLLKSNTDFVNEVDALIQGGQFHNSIGTFFAGIFKKGDKATANPSSTDESGSSSSSSSSSSGGSNTGAGIGAAVGGFFTGTGGIVTSIVGALGGNNASRAESDAAFYEAVASAQKDNDTSKLLIISGVSVAILALGVILVIKLKK